jgi:3-hydroxymyristoyl/3-hydroxydecanoyl-(acyl carrier protein) dehydratase
VNWMTGVVDHPAKLVRQAISCRERVYLLIVNTPGECVVGGHRPQVEALARDLGCRLLPLSGVSTVHCEIARQVEHQYRELHLLPTVPPAGVRFYSGAWARTYDLTSESAAESIVAQAIQGIDFPAVIERAYADGVRVFVEMGPGASCSRMIGQILGGRPHLTRSACVAGHDPVSAVLRLLGELIAARVPVDLEALYGRESRAVGHVVGRGRTAGPSVVIPVGGEPFRVPSLPTPRHHTAAESVLPGVSHRQVSAAAPSAARATNGPSLSTVAKPAASGASIPGADALVRQFVAAEAAKAEAHEAYLSVADRLAQAMANQAAFHTSLLGAAPGPGVVRAGDRVVSATGAAVDESSPRRTNPQADLRERVFLDRGQCREFAVGSIARVLGPEYAEVDGFPTRVRLPDEPLMLVDRVVSVEGEPRSMTAGRVVTEHDVLPGAWYLDGGRIPTCIAIEAGQADLFLAGYLGIDFHTRGRAVYRLLDAAVTFQRELPGPGETIRYDIRIERFFRQGDTWLFRFQFDGTVDGEPLLTMRDGCAGFFTAEELAAGRGVAQGGSLCVPPRSGVRPDDWQELVPMRVEAYDERQLAALRAGDLAGSFGPAFVGLGLQDPLWLPGGRMKLIDRVPRLDPCGGRYGLGLIRAEADVHPDDWFLTCHFTGDRVMPGTLMYECCLHTLRVFLMRMGWVGEQGEIVCEPVPGVASRLKCRGQVIESTKQAAYEVSIKEFGYRPEPYAIADAVMYSDGRPIVEITDMALRLTGLTREKLHATWRAGVVNPPITIRHRTESCDPVVDTRLSPARKRSTVLFDHDRILTFATGKPSEAFGEPYRVFDEGRFLARLPAPPYNFLHRITDIRAEAWKMAPGGVIEAEYDVPPDAWYFAGDRQDRMPFAVLLEVALQSCGWLAAYMGSALTSSEDLAFRNLGGTARHIEPVPRDAGTLTTTVHVTKAATSAGMIIQSYDFEVQKAGRPVYSGDTTFGFFPRDALARQTGIREVKPYVPTQEEAARGQHFEYPQEPPFPDARLRMIDRTDLYVPDGGPHCLGLVHGTKHVDPEEWFFKAHFHQDPVWPGSLGLEGFLQLLKLVAAKRWGVGSDCCFTTASPNFPHRWGYRGQVTPDSKEIRIQAVVTAADDEKRRLRADGLLWADGRVIYQMRDFSLGIDREAP